MTQVISSDAFSLLKLPIAFDLPQLEDQYLLCQQWVHPDGVSGSLAKKGAQALSAKINEAYRLLKNPVTRAACMLQAVGHWPVAIYPDILEEIFFLKSGAEKENFLVKERMEEACQDFVCAFKKKEFIESEKAYTWMCYLEKWWA